MFSRNFRDSRPYTTAAAADYRGPVHERSIISTLLYARMSKNTFSKILNGVSHGMNGLVCVCVKRFYIINAFFTFENFYLLTIVKIGNSIDSET